MIDLKKLEYALTKDSLCNAERVDEALMIVRRELAATQPQSGEPVAVTEAMEMAAVEAFYRATQDDAAGVGGQRPVIMYLHLNYVVRAAIDAALASAPHAPAPEGVAVADIDDGAMTPEEIRLDNLKQMATYDGPIVSFEVREPYYLASCDHCGWVGSSEHCGTDSFGDDSDVFCPRCFTSGADCGKIASRLSASPPVSEDAVEVTNAMIAAAGAKYREIGARCNWQHSWPSGEAFREILEASLSAKESGQ